MRNGAHFNHNEGTLQAEMMRKGEQCNKMYATLRVTPFDWTLVRCTMHWKHAPPTPGTVPSRGHMLKHRPPQAKSTESWTGNERCCMPTSSKSTESWASAAASTSEKKHLSHGNIKAKPTSRSASESWAHGINKVLSKTPAM